MTGPVHTARKNLRRRSSVKRYDLVIIGGGVGGLVAASGSAQLGARVALVDRNPTLGGDCLLAGCVPTKRLVESAKVAHTVRRAGEYGVVAGEPRVDFHRVMQSMREVQSKIGEHDDPERFRRMGVDIYFGSGSFTDPKTFEVSGEKLRGRRFLIATGSGPVILPIPGLKESGVLTNETALELRELPGTMTILGAGPIGVEFAQVFARLGVEVTIVEKTGQVLPREDPELSEILREVLEREGIKIDICTEVKNVERQGEKKALTARCPVGNHEHDHDYVTDEIMIAIGRAPNVKGLGLDAAGVEFSERRGIKVDDRLRTTAKHIYACGDVIGHYQFTHVAEYQAGVVIGNALFPFTRRRVDYSAVPWTTFTDPELARVGMTEAEAREKHGDKVRVYRHEIRENDRAVIEGEPTGLVKLVCDKKGKLLGAHVLGPSAGELIGEYVLAMQHGLPVSAVSRTIHVYPTLAQSVKRAADQYYREKLFTGWFPRLARFLIRLGRLGR